MPDQIKVLVTGAGGPAGMGSIRSLTRAKGISLVAADMNPLAPGLYWVQERIVLPPAHDTNFITVLISHCKRMGIDFLFPTVDEEISSIANNIDKIRKHVACVISSKNSIELCNDKLRTFTFLKGLGIPAVETFDVDDEESLHETASKIGYPVVIKPRASRGGRGLHICWDLNELTTAYSNLRMSLPFSDAYIGVPEASRIVIQEHLPGSEYDTIVLLDQDNDPLACVPMKARRWMVKDQLREIVTEHDDEVEELSIRTVQKIKLEGPIDVESAKDKEGRLKILDVNPRIGGDVDLATSAGCNIPLMFVHAGMGGTVRPSGFKEGVILVRYVGIQTIHPEDIPRNGGKSDDIKGIRQSGNRKRLHPG